MEKEPEGRDIYFTKYDNLIPVEALFGLDTLSELPKGINTGRTFRKMLLTIHAASANPGHWIQIKDHELGNDMLLGKRIKELLEKLDVTYSFQFMDTFSKEDLARKYYIRFRTPSFRSSPYTY